MKTAPWWRGFFMGPASLMPMKKACMKQALAGAGVLTS
jgi:hypothetical protein